jgi:hypothetical protein
MLKGSSLCLHSSNFGTFWLKIEQFWPFEEISIFSNSGHIEWRAGSPDTIFEGGLCPNLNCIIIMMSLSLCETGFFIQFELLPIFTEYAN